MQSQLVFVDLPEKTLIQQKVDNALVQYPLFFFSARETPNTPALTGLDSLLIIGWYPWDVIS
jgi:hypothetical protein